MRLLVVGANGLLGSNVVRTGLQGDWEVSGTYHSGVPNFAIPLSQFDLQNYEQFDVILDEHEPDVVVNCAAMTDVDACENYPAKAHRINGEAPGKMAASCDEKGIAFIHISTDYVFDGTVRAPYSESAEPNPIQEYGKSKLAGEIAVREVSEEALIARLSFVWGVHRSSVTVTGFPAWVLGRLQAGEEVPLFTGQKVTPTRAGEAANTLLDLISKGQSGIYHVASSSCISPFEFGTILADVLGADQNMLKKVSLEDVERNAERPTYSCLNVEKVERTLGKQEPKIREDIEAISEQLRQI